MSLFLDSVIGTLKRITKTRPVRRDLHPLWARALQHDQSTRLLVDPSSEESSGKEEDEWNEEALIEAGSNYGLLERILLWEYITVAVPDEHSPWLFPNTQADILHNIAESSKFKNYAIAVIVNRLQPTKSRVPVPKVDITEQDMYPEARQIETPERIRFAFPWLDDTYQPWTKPANSIVQEPARSLWYWSSGIFAYGPTAQFAIGQFFSIYRHQQVHDLKTELMQYARNTDPDITYASINIRPELGLGETLYYDSTNAGEELMLRSMITKYTVVLFLYVSIVVRAVVISFAFSAKYLLDNPDLLEVHGEVPIDILSDLYGHTPLVNYHIVIKEYVEKHISLTDNIKFILSDAASELEGVPVRTRQATESLSRHMAMHAYAVLKLWSSFKGNFDDVVFGTYQLRLVLERLGSTEHKAVSVETAPVGTSPKITPLHDSLVVHIRIDRIELRQNQNSPQFMLWTSHDLTNLIQDVSSTTEDTSTGMFIRRMSMSGAVVTPVFDAKKGTILTVRIRFKSGLKQIPTRLFEQAALCIALYVQQKDTDDAVPITRRRGVGFALLKEFLMTQQENKHISLRLWEGPTKADYTIDPNTYRTEQPMEYYKTCSIDVVVRNLPSSQEKRGGISSNVDVFASTKGTLIVGASAPRSLVPGKEYEIHINKFILKSLEEYAKAGDSAAYHSLMLLMWPGTPTFRILALESRAAPHTIGFYETLLRHQMWRDNVSDDEFMRIFNMAYSKDHPYRIFAHERLWWIMTMALSFVNICIYKLDVFEKRNVEIMENITIAMAGDCEDDSLALCHAVMRLKSLPMSEWEPLRLVQLVLRYMLPFQMVMTTSAASLASVGTAGPILHSTCILIPVWQVDFDKSKGAPLNVIAIEKPRILEGTGIYSGWLASIWHCFGSYTNIPGGVLESVERYKTLRAFLVGESPFDAPTVGDTGSNVSAYKQAETHPFFGNCVSICGPDIIQGGDKLLLFHSYKETAAHHYPHFSAVLSGNFEEYTLRPGPGRDTDVDKYSYVTLYFPPAPFFDGKPIPLDVQTETNLRNMPMKHIEIASAETRNRGAGDGDADILRFKACTVFMNAKASANPANVMKKKLDAFMKSQHARSVISVDWKVLQIMYGVVQYEIRVTY